ncbi:DUF547 domain-containing protein [Mucisphaera calidilacus]|uniref:DUF547 domain-containing protein n=1 Tax=Mucisphaera calidilacus TaxID=2527982 RepID=A0A518BXJ7_9BACT|nr:DUF547 domain-containing protein [Mucisphaera calidilacus]QDU71699.1 hypothetical protein Pan265_15510 [Mucisphaera calidilacus]
MLTRTLALILVLLLTAPATLTAQLGGIRGIARNATGTAVDHAPFDAILKAHVNDEGRVNYAALARNPQPLDAYIESLARVDFDTLEDDAQLALLINAYNAFTLKLITEYYDNGNLKTIMDIPEARRWNHRRWNIAGSRYSLDQIEHKLIRPVYNEPRIHFVLVCAAESCPILRRHAYTAENLERQLEQATAASHKDRRWAYYDTRRNTLHLTKLYEWYAQDFIGASGSVEDYAARYLPDLKRTLDRGRKPRIQYIDYSWDLNAQR